MGQTYSTDNSLTLILDVLCNGVYMYFNVYVLLITFKNCLKAGVVFRYV